MRRAALAVVAVAAIAVVALAPIGGRGDDGGDDPDPAGPSVTGPQRTDTRERLPEAATADPATLPPAVDAVLTGRVVEQDGTPADGVTAVLHHSTGEAEPLAFVVFSVFAGGLPLLTCLESPPNPCDDEVTDTVPVDDDGGYEVTLPSAHVPGYETDTDWYFIAEAPVSLGQRYPTTASYELEVAAPVQHAPDLVLWRPGATADTTDGRVVLSWTPLDDDLYDPGTLDHRVSVLDQNGVPLAELGGGGDSVSFDGRLLEDQLVTTALTATLDVTVSPTIYHQVITAPGADVTGIGPAPSRDAACSIGAAQQPLSPCPLTDGNLTLATLGSALPPCAESPTFDEPFGTVETIPAPDFPEFEEVPLPPPPSFPPFTFPESSPPPTFTDAPPPEPSTTTTTAPPTTTTTSVFPFPAPKSARQVPLEPTCPTEDVVITLGGPTDLDLVVLRGCATCEVATSTDGVTFTPMPHDPRRRTPVSTVVGIRAPAAPVPATHLRVTGTVDELFGLQEVSAWPATEAGAGAELAEPVEPTERRRASRAERVAVLVAVALIVVTAVALHGRWQAGQLKARMRP